MAGPEVEQGREDARAKDPRVSLEAPIRDERGAIQPLVDGEFGSAQLITSRAGTVRANHYHRRDSHYMYLVSGAFDYFDRPAGSTEEPRRTRVRAGEMVYTPPLVEHAVRFVEDSVFVNFAAGHRDQASYEADLVRVELIPASVAS